MGRFGRKMKKKIGLQFSYKWIYACPGQKWLICRHSREREPYKKIYGNQGKYIRL